MAGEPEPTLVEVIRRAIESRVGDVFTTVPGRIDTYDPDTQTADVLPVVRRPMPTEDDGTVYEDLPIIPNVPIVWPRANGAYIVWPIRTGDHVLLMFTTHSFAGWRRTGEVSDSGDVRPHHPGNAVAIPGLGPNADPIDTAAASFDGMTIHHPTVIRLDSGATDFVALAQKVTDQLTALKSAISGAAVTPGPAIDNGAAFKAGILAALSGWPGDVAATKVKAL